MDVLLIGLGGALGAVLRWLGAGAATRLFGAGFPFGTAAVNVAGSFVMGLAAAAIIERAGASARLGLFLMTGVLGGFTTFSAFSLDAIRLIEAGRAGAAAAYIAGSVALSVLALWFGLLIGRAG